VRDAFRDEPRVDLRFFDADRAKHAEFRENTITARFISRNVGHRAEQVANAIKVPGTSQSVIGAVQQLLLNGVAA
jgi:hypothetical protein